MALLKDALKAEILALVNELKTYDGSSGKEQQKAIDKFADGLATAIDTFVKTGTVTVAFPIAVQVVPATGTGATTSPGTGTIA